MQTARKKIEELISLELVFVLVILIFVSGLVYFFLKRKLSSERRDRLRSLFQNLLRYLLSFAGSFALYESIQYGSDADPLLTSLQSFLGLSTIILGSTVLIKACRILLFEYLFATSLKYGVPVLLVNIFTLALSLSIATWIATYLFSIRVVSVLATSAIASVILGLALQETLGNLFSGIALQFDKPFEIDDWVEINNDGQKYVGKVLEITWRATTLIGIGDETILVPNRVLAQAQVTNFSVHGRPFVRRHSIRIDHTEDAPAIRKLLIEAVQNIDGVEKLPSVDVFLVDLNESWIEFRVVYYIRNYAQQFTIADAVLERCLATLRRSGRALAKPKLVISSIPANC